MPDLETPKNLGNTTLTPHETVASVDMGQKLNLEKGPEAEQPNLSQEDQLKNSREKVQARQQEINRLNKSVEGTKAKLNEVREKLGLSPTGEDPPSVFSENDRLKKLKGEQEALEKQQEELISQQEKEKLIREEKVKILQEKLDELFEQFEGLNFLDLESISSNGKTSDGLNVESKSMGSLEPEVAQSLARVFRKRIELPSQILEIMPKLLEKFGENLTQEATERVNKRLEKAKMEKDQKEKEKPEEPKLEDKPKIPEEEVPVAEIKKEITPK